MLGPKLHGTVPPFLPIFMVWCLIKQRDSITFLLLVQTFIIIINKIREFKFCASMKPREMTQAVLILPCIKELSVQVSINILTESLLGFTRPFGESAIQQTNKLCGP
jgi:hypothetical protein